MKTFLTLMAGSGSRIDLEELWEPIKGFFDGICATCFAEIDSEETLYLEANKGGGMVICLPYVGRHSLARNVALHCGKIEDGDWVVVTDTLERPNPTFLSWAFVAQHHMMVDKENRYPNLYYFHSKPLLFRYHESLEYRGTPHESLVRLDGKGRGCELKDYYPNEVDVRANIRPMKRPADHWVGHFARYMLGPFVSNHALLGLEKNGDPNVLFPIREAKRLAFRDEMLQRGFPFTLEGLKRMLSGPIDPKLRDMINSDKVWSDWYWYYIKGRKDVVCSHDDRDMIRDEIPIDILPQSN